MSKDPGYLAQLQDYYALNRTLPSFPVVGKLLGLSSTSSVAALVKRLKATGHLEQGPDRRIKPGRRFFERAIVDTVRAGLPAAAVEAPAEAVTIDEQLIDVPSRTVMLTVKGNSMQEAGILPGDTVIVVKGAPAKIGDIVVAIVDNEFTVKYLDIDKKGAFFLRAGNVAYPPIKPRETLELFGVVVGSYRKYK